MLAYENGNPDKPYLARCGGCGRILDFQCECATFNGEKIATCKDCYEKGRSMNDPEPKTCPKCGGAIIQTAHGPYCPKDACKWGWEVEMDGSPLKPPVER